MELGEKIKQARLEMGFSQRQLCGDVITRNMLSQIENGSARPSMDTLRYFAARLEKPVSYFLEEQAVLLPNQQLMDQARQCFGRGEYRQVTQLLEGYRRPDRIFDPECGLLEALSFLEQAKQAVAEEKLVYARTLLQKAEEAAQSTDYFIPALQREWVLTAAAADPDRAAQLTGQLRSDDRELLLRARVALKTGDFAKGACFLDGAQNRDSCWNLLRGQAAMGQKEYALAATCFLQAEDAYPVRCAKALEICYREQEDYKQAYHYACKHRQLLSADRKNVEDIAHYVDKG